MAQPEREVDRVDVFERGREKREVGEEVNRSDNNDSSA
jgi:hypothetical protein